MTKTTPLLITLFLLMCSFSQAEEKSDTTSVHAYEDIVEVVAKIKSAEYDEIDDYVLFPIVTNCKAGQNYSTIAKNEFVDSLSSYFSEKILERLIKRNKISISYEVEDGLIVGHEVKFNFDYIEYDVIAQTEVKIKKNIVLYFKKCSDKLRLEKYMCDM